jgi:hypothetical protein
MLGNSVSFHPNDQRQLGKAFSTCFAQCLLELHVHCVCIGTKNVHCVQAMCVAIDYARVF